MSLNIQGTTTVESQLEGSTQSFSNYATESSAIGVFSDAAATSTQTPGWNEIQTGWYVWGAGANNATVAAIEHSAGVVTLDGGEFMPGHLYVFRAIPYPVA